MSVEVKTVKDVMKESRSIKEICEKFPEFEHNPERTGGEIQCIVCNTGFAYDKEEEHDFKDKFMSRKFRNCKLIVVRHLEKDTHSLQLTKNDSMEKVRVKEEKRNKKVGLTLGRIVYHLVYKGIVDTNYTAMVYIAASGGSDCGDINYENGFVRKLLPHLAGRGEYSYEIYEIIS